MRTAVMGIQRGMGAGGGGGDRERRRKPGGGGGVVKCDEGE